MKTTPKIPSEQQATTPTKAASNPASTPGPTRRRSISMHEGIAVWCDCCSCEAEPYWVEIGKEMGMELGGDYEDAPER